MLDFTPIMTYLTQLFQVFGNSYLSFSILGFSASFLAFLFNKNFKFNKLDFLGLAFIIIFLVSLYFRQAPFGFIESTAVLSSYLLYKVFQIYDFSHVYKSKYTKLFIVTTIILTMVEFYYSNFERLPGLTNFNQSLITYPNAWAFLMGVIIIYNLKNKFSILNSLLLLSSTMSLVLTQSRTTILILAILLFFTIFHSFFKKDYLQILKKISIVFLGFTFALVFLYSKGNLDQFNQRIQSQNISSLSSFEQRFSFFNDAIKMSKDNLLLGVGPGNFSKIQPKYSTDFYTLSEHPHNILLKIQAELGLFATLIFIVSILYLSFMNRNNFDDPNFLSFWFILGQSTFDYNLNFAFALILLIFALSKLKTSPQKDYDFMSKIIFGIVVLNLISISFYVLPKYFYKNYNYWIESSNQDLSLKYPNYFAFNINKVDYLTPFNNLDLHYQYLTTKKTNQIDSDFYVILLNDVYQKTLVNYNFLVTDNQVPAALKIACHLSLSDEFNKIKLAYLNELSKLDIKITKNENINCNTKSR